jgi:hypothetical protein
LEHTLSDSHIGNSQGYQLARMLPLLLFQLREGDYHEFVVSFDRGLDSFIVNAVAHKDCEEHGCVDDDCRELVHKKSTVIAISELDKVLTELFESYNRAVMAR